MLQPPHNFLLKVLLKLFKSIFHKKSLNEIQVITTE